VVSAYLLPRGDTGGDPCDHIFLISLATNYRVSEGLDVTESFKKYCEIVERVFEPPKEVGWWLEYMSNHNPGSWRVGGLLLRFRVWCILADHDLQWPEGAPECMDTWDVGMMYHD